MTQDNRDCATDVPRKRSVANCSFLPDYFDHLPIELFQVLTPLRFILAGWFGVDAAGNGIARNHSVRKIHFD
jgi:hypothetical protein